MGADGQPGLTRFPAAALSFLRASIVRKLTFFVGVLVALNCGVLIAVAYFTTSAILRDQIQERLSTVAADRQEILTGELRQQGQRASELAERPFLRQVLALRATGTMAADRFRRETDPILARVRSNTTGFLALWIEDEAGH